MRNLLVVDLLVKAAVANAVNLETQDALKYVEGAFAGAKVDTLKTMVEAGVLEMSRNSLNEMCEDVQPYYAKVGDRFVHLDTVYGVCPVCGKKVPVELNEVIKNGLIVPDMIYCEECIESAERKEA